jgi:hypothetical protein
MPGKDLIIFQLRINRLLIYNLYWNIFFDVYYDFSLRTLDVFSFLIFYLYNFTHELFLFHVKQVSIH